MNGTASIEALAAVARLFSSGAKVKRSSVAEAFDAFAAPFLARAYAAEREARKTKQALADAEARLAAEALKPPVMLVPPFRHGPLPPIPGRGVSG